MGAKPAGILEKKKKRKRKKLSRVCPDGLLGLRGAESRAGEVGELQGYPRGAQGCPGGPHPPGALCSPWGPPEATTDILGTSLTSWDHH